MKGWLMFACLVLCLAIGWPHHKPKPEVPVVPDTSVLIEQDKAMERRNAAIEFGASLLFQVYEDELAKDATEAPWLKTPFLDEAHDAIGELLGMPVDSPEYKEKFNGLHLLMDKIAWLKQCDTI
jgi:hypothetical protein